MFRFAEWTIGPERDGDGHAAAPVRETQCRTCGGMSEPDAEQGTTDRWAMRHTGLTDHRSFREITTAALTVRPAPTSPLYDHDQETTSKGAHP